MKIQNNTIEEVPEILKKEIKIIYTIYNEEFQTKQEAVEYAFCFSFKQLNMLLKELDYLISKRGTEKAITEGEEFLYKLMYAIQEYKSINDLREKYTGVHNENT
jgi:hypothetical protein